MSRIPLSPEQLRVILQLARGHDNKQCAQLLHISVATVSYHVARLERLTGCPNRTSLVLLCVLSGVLTQRDRGLSLVETSVLHWNDVVNESL